MLDLTNLRYFFRTYESSQIRVVKLADFQAGNYSDVVQFARTGEETFENIADTATAIG